ncbi:MAG: ParB/RepB/Spo0J family partition protein [Caldilineaceae bacterium]|nr:ParB/RepB/Spo0J family partition protein [Caldilineaceae bacterium]
MASIVDVKRIPLVDLIIDLGQVRKKEVSRDIDELADSIARVGLLEPIVVSPTKQEGQYEIITGQRRFLAHQLLKRETILAAILDEQVDEITAKVLSVTENLVRRDLHSNDLIDVCTYLYKHYGSLKAVCEETGLAYGKVSQYVKYDQLMPELKQMVDNGDVKLDTALKAQRASQMNADEAVQFALEMEPMSGAQRSAIVKRREKEPNVSADDIIEEAKSGGKITQIVVTLTSEVHSALGQYASIHQTSADDAAGMLIREGLYSNNLLEDTL